MLNSLCKHWLPTEYVNASNMGLCEAFLIDLMSKIGKASSLRYLNLNFNKCGATLKQILYVINFAATLNHLEMSNCGLSHSQVGLLVKLTIGKLRRFSEIS